MKPDKNDFKKRLAAYCTLSAGFLAMHSDNASAQIIYTDVNPDSVLNGFAGGGSSYQLDLNNDGIVDFRLKNRARSSTSTYMGGNQAFYGYYLTNNRIDAYGVNQILGSSLGNFPKPLSLGDTINTNNVLIPNGVLKHWYLMQSFSTGWSTVSISVYSESGLFEFGTEKYIGLKLIMGGNTYYGWARVRIDWGQLTVYDYAVNSSPNQQILAGQQ